MILPEPNLVLLLLFTHMRQGVRCASTAFQGCGGASAGRVVVLVAGMKRVQKMLAVCPVRMEDRLRLAVVQMPRSVSSEPLSMVVPESSSSRTCLGVERPLWQQYVPQR